MLLDREDTPHPSRSLLSPRWMDPFRILARTAPNTYRLDIPATWRVFTEFNAFSHVVAYNRKTSALRGTADTLLDAAHFGSRWVLLSPAPAAGVARALRPRPPRP